jgi:glutathione synthase/RimK-type ligase-like ATP-grasp enzyme
MKILITSARAPVALEWVQIALKSGHNVVLVDTLEHPLSKSLSGTEYQKVASPRFAFHQYKKDMLTLIAECDFVIPTCEDIFYLTKIVGTDSKLKKKVFAPSFETLKTLHDKYRVQELLNSEVLFPETKLITEKSDIDIHNPHSILKPVYSRFGSNIITNISEESISGIICNETEPWVQQQKVDGEYICSYAVINHGKVVSHVVYKPKYLVNNAAATYFEYTEDTRCDAFISAFAKEHSYHGQIAFDFIRNEEGLFVIECNPRATSGIHLLASKIAISSTNIASIKGESIYGSCRLGPTLLFMFGLRAFIAGTIVKLFYDYRKASNVLSKISIVNQLMSLKELHTIARRERITLAEASSFDIEYNG